jgi:hypothetical protein
MYKTAEARFLEVVGLLEPEDGRPGPGVYADEEGQVQILSFPLKKYGVCNLWHALGCAENRINLVSNPWNTLYVPLSAANKFLADRDVRTTRHAGTRNQGDPPSKETVLETGLRNCLDKVGKELASEVSPRDFVRDYMPGYRYEAKGRDARGRPAFRVINSGGDGWEKDDSFRTALRKAKKKL